MVINVSNLLNYCDLEANSKPAIQPWFLECSLVASTMEHGHTHLANIHLYYVYRVFVDFKRDGINNFKVKISICTKFIDSLSWYNQAWRKLK